MMLKHMLPGLRQATRLSHLLMFLGIAYIENNMDPDQTGTEGFTVFASIKKSSFKSVHLGKRDQMKGLISLYVFVIS